MGHPRAARASAPSAEASRSADSTQLSCTTWQQDGSLRNEDAEEEEEAEEEVTGQSGRVQMPQLGAL